MDRPAHVYKTYINATVEDVWDSITNPDKTEKYFYGTRVESGWEVGSAIVYHYPDGTLAADGEIVAIDPPKRLELTFRALWDAALAEEGPARETWSLNETNGMVELTVEIYEIGDKTLEAFKEGLPYIISGLKSLVETGHPLPSPS